MITDTGTAISRYAEPASEFWRNQASYTERLINEFLVPLESEAKECGKVSAETQLDVLLRLHWYFTVDMRERAPTVTLAESQADAFHAVVTKIMKHVAPASINEAAKSGINTEVLHALLSYHDLTHASVATVTALDREQGLARIEYYVHGAKPSEIISGDGVALKPAYEKYRGCHFFHRLRLRQRIVWVPVIGVRSLQIELDGQPHPLGVGRLPFSIANASEKVSFGVSMQDVECCIRPGRAALCPQVSGWRAWRAACVYLLAKLPIVKKRFHEAWVFVDRNENAEDNAEVLCRWVMRNRPDINAWFLLDRDSPDWPRLEQDGFRLMARGWMRTLLVLNSKHIISSHAEYMEGGLDPTQYGRFMGWKYSFLQHGVINNDISHWLGPKDFDAFMSSSPAEYRSIIEDDSNYPYTAREVKLTGLPRHDRLIGLSRLQGGEIPNRLLVMPTWRGGVFEERVRGLDSAARKAAFTNTEYARKWKSFLHNSNLQRILQDHGWSMAFMPHANSVPYLDFFDPPPTVEVMCSVSSAAFVSAGAFLTDYTSAAFEVALLRKPVFYYQFDREFFYNGGHNWRPGYFDYDKDGFGPVFLDEDALVGGLRKFLESGAEVAPVYRERMENAMPMQDEDACKRNYECILSLTTPFSLHR